MFWFVTVLERKCFIIPEIEHEEYFTKYDNSYLEQYDELFLIMYVYLQRHRSIEGFVNLTIKDFILYYNFTPNRNKGRINEKVYNTLQLMIDREFIRYTGCFSNGGLATLDGVDCDMMFTVQLINFDEKWNPASKFTKILYSEVDKLRTNNVKPIDKILCLYLNIKKYISADAEGTTAQLFAYPSEPVLAKACDCGLSSIKKYTDILCDIGMLFMKNFGSYKKLKRGKEVIENSSNVYALEEKNLNESAKEAYKEVLKNDYNLIDGFYSFCDNLPNNKEVTDINTDDDTDAVNTGESENDYSVEEILDMPTTSDIKSDSNNEDSVPVATKVVVIKSPAKNNKTDIPENIVIQRYADELYKEHGDTMSMFIMELTDKFTDLSEDDCKEYWIKAKRYSELCV